MFVLVAQICRAVAAKGTIGVRLKAAYDAGDRDELRRIADEDVSAAVDAVSELKREYRRQWHRRCKPFGFEVLDGRLSAVIGRLETAAARVTDYLDGTVAVLEELEAERLPLAFPVSARARSLWANRDTEPFVQVRGWDKIVTASEIGKLA